VDLEHILWRSDHEPGEPTLRRQLESEGFDVSVWRDPSGRTYEPHSHEWDESLWVLRGRIVFRVAGRDYPLGPGDRLMLPRGIPHAAEAGPEGATYLIGQRREA
jgi:quercetin dioxygenase-like cupin family protein